MASIPVDENGNPIAGSGSSPAVAGATGGGRSIPVDENGNPIPPQQSTVDAITGNAEAGGKLVGRSAIHYALAPADFLVSGMRALGKELDKTGLTAPQPQLIDTNGQPIGGANAPLPSEAAIQDVSKAVPLQMDPNAGPAMKFADIVLPIVLSAGRSGIANASSAASIPWAVTKEIAKQGTGAAASTAAGAGAQYLGGDDLAQLVASIAAGGATLKSIQAYGTQRIANRYGSPDAAQTTTDAQDLGIKPTFSMLATPEGKMLEANLAANPLVGGGVKAKMADVQDTLNNRISQEAGNVGYGGSPLFKARNPDAMGSDLISESQARQTALDQANSAAQEAVDTQARRYPPDVGSLAEKIQNLSQGPDVDPTTTGPLDARLAALREMIRRQNPPPAEPGPDYVPPTTSSYDALKAFTGNLGRKTAGADPLESGLLKQVYPDAVAALHGSAEQAGVGDAADAARAQTRTMYREQFPPLRKVGGKLGGVDPDTGEQLFEGTPPAGAASGVFERAASTEHSGNPELMRQLDEHMQGGAVGRALADIIRRAGTKSGDFRLEHFAPDWNQVNEQARASIGNRSPETPETLDKVARLSDVFLRKPATSGLTDTLGLQAALAMMPGNWATKTAATLALMRGLNSNSMLNAMAGRGGMSDLLGSYLQNLPVQQQTTQRVLHGQ